MNFVSDLWRQTRNKTTQQKRGRKAYDSLSQGFKLREIVIDKPLLGELEQRTCRIFIVRGCKASLQSLQEASPRSDLSISCHPLIPCKCWTIHVKRSDRQPFIFRRGMVVEERVYFKEPPDKIKPIEAWDFEIHSVWWNRRRRKGRMHQRRNC